MRFMLMVIVLAVTPAARADTLLGFDEASSAAQRELEAAYDADLSAADMDRWLRRLSARPHHVGSAAGNAVAEQVHELLASWGYQTEFAEYEILLPTPRLRELEMTAPTRFAAALTEDTLPEDPSTAARDGLLPPYNAFSVDGEVAAELVYVNYGIPEDYDVLERYGVDVEGKIVIARYGKSWRGIKPKLAAEKGAIGALIYSDPADDGYGAGDTYPKGPFKHASAVQRGSVVDMPTYPGDVLTPGRGATKRARRLRLEDVEVITKIPVLPIAWRDALPLLRALEGEVVPADWRGGLPITYHFGPGPTRVRLKLEFAWDMVTARNVIARLPGARYPDQWVVRGNHHDAWNHGAADPISGLVALLAEARSVARLAADGRGPLRTIVYAAWDAEEQGLIGSTEWAEHHAAELKDKAVAYINTDGNSRGFVSIGGSHTLEAFFDEIAGDVEDPLLEASVKARRIAQQQTAGSDEQKKDARERASLRLYPLGSGSDYTPFLQHLGIASVNLSFSGEGPGGSYHTLYDTYEHYTRFRDPGLRYGVALAQVAGRATLRLANAPRLPFEFKGFADNVALYVKQLEELADKMREETATTNEMLDEGVYDLSRDPTKEIAPPKRHPLVPHFNFAPLKNALARLERASSRYQAKGGASAELNELLYKTERLLTRDAGLAGRPWYRHHVYAPGFYTGYGVKTLPGVREAIEERNYADVEREIEIVAGVLEGLAARIEEIVAADGA